LAERLRHAPLHDLDGLIDDSHLAAVGLLQSIEHPTEGTLRVAGPAATWSKTPPSIRQYPPRLGEHGGEILREAGFSSSDIEALVAKGAVVESDPRINRREPSPVYSTSTPGIFWRSHFDEGIQAFLAILRRRDKRKTLGRGLA